MEPILTAPEPTTAPAHHERCHTSCSVLVLVEDDPDDLVLLRRALGKVGQPEEVYCAQTGAEAFALLAELESHPGPICVVADLKLPDMDGFELLTHLRSRFAPDQLKFAFLTGHGDSSTHQRALDSGADAFFIKPVECVELLGIVRELQKLFRNG